MLRPLLLLLGVTLVVCNPTPGDFIGGGNFPGGGNPTGGIHSPGQATCRYWCKTPENQVYCCEEGREPESPVYVKPGNCPPVRLECPAVRLGGLPPKICAHDGKCDGPNKCCFDRCLNEHVCKPPQTYF